MYIFEIIEHDESSTNSVEKKRVENAASGDAPKAGHAFFFQKGKAKI